MKCKSIIAILEQLAPVKYASDWDNVGLLAGREEKEVKKIMIALDASEQVVNQAIQSKADMLITHHPMIFSPMKKITSNHFIGKRLIRLIQQDISYYAMHTNFDMAVMAEAAAKKLELQNTRILSPEYEEELYKIVVFVPEGSQEKVRMAMTREGAGFIGNYSSCTFNLSGIGTYMPLPGTNPYIGSANGLTMTNETRIETIVDKARKKQVIDAMIKAHPYEEVAYDIYPLLNKHNVRGIGRFGYLNQDTSLNILAMQVKLAFGLPYVQVSGDLERVMAAIAIVPGSGKGYIKEAIKAGADVLITGDMNHHAALDAMEQGLAIIDATHFGTEHLMAEYVKEYLNQYLHKITWNLNEEDLDISIIIAKEQNPFVVI